MAENKNKYQKLTELIHKSPKLLGSGGLFGGFNENHTVFVLFAAYVKKEKERYNKIPKTIGIDNFINYLISDSGRSQEEISKIEKKLDYLKRQGDIRDDSLRDVGKNTLYQFAIILDELGLLEKHSEQSSGLYNEALRDSLQGVSAAEPSEADQSTEVGRKTEVAEPKKEEEPEKAQEAEAEADVEAEISGEVSGEVSEAQVSARIKSAATPKAKIAQISPTVPIMPAAEATPESPETLVQPPVTPSPTIPTSAEASVSTRLPTIPTETGAVLSPLTPSGLRSGLSPVRTFGGPRGAIFTGGTPQTRKKIRPLRSIQILGGGSGTQRTAAPKRVSAEQAEQTAEQTAEAQLQALQQSQATPTKAGGGTAYRPGKKRKSLAVRLAKYTAAGAGSVPFLPLLGGSSAEAFTGSAGTFSATTGVAFTVSTTAEALTTTVNFLFNLLF